MVSSDHIEHVRERRCSCKRAQHPVQRQPPARFPRAHCSANSEAVSALICRKQNHNQTLSFVKPSVFISILPQTSPGSSLLSGQPFLSLEWNAMNKNVFPEALFRVTSNEGEFPVRKGIKGSGWKFYRPTQNKPHSLFLNVLGHAQLILDPLVQLETLPGSPFWIGDPYFHSVWIVSLRAFIVPGNI